MRKPAAGKVFKPRRGSANAFTEVDRREKALYRALAVDRILDSGE